MPLRAFRVDRALEVREHSEALGIRERQYLAQDHTGDLLRRVRGNPNLVDT